MCLKPPRHAMVEARKIWKVCQPDAAEVERVAVDNGLLQPLARALVNRGLTDTNEIDLFLRPKLQELGDPFDLPDMQPAVERLWQALHQQERILVYGDYDVDGVTSTALMKQVLEKLGGRVATFIPHRIDDGYGLNPETLAHCVDTFDPKVILTVDCGTGSVESVKQARTQGIDVIVTDHHEASYGVAPAHAMVNPKQGDNSALHQLAGCGVAFKLCHGLVKYGRKQNFQSCLSIDLREYLYLVAMGTVADVVPLRGENRVMVRYGLHLMNRNPAISVRALREVAAINGPISGYHLGFLIGPRINAAGRMDNPATALDLLLETSLERARPLAEALNQANKDRQQIEQDIFDQACAVMDDSFEAERDYVIVAAEEGWHPGVVGIVASRLVGRYNRPSVVIGFDPKTGVGKGSCRSIDGFDLVRHLGLASTHLRKFGGHQMAAGLEIHRDHVDAFRAEFNRVAGRSLTKTMLQPFQVIDGWLEKDEISKDVLGALLELSPFGSKNPVPTWAARNLKVVRGPYVVKDRHLKLYFDTGRFEVEGFGFNMADREVKPGDQLDVAFQMQLNTYMGHNTLQLTLKDFRSSG